MKSVRKVDNDRAKASAMGFKTRFGDCEAFQAHARPKVESKMDFLTPKIGTAKYCSTSKAFGPYQGSFHISYTRLAVLRQRLSDKTLLAKTEYLTFVMSLCSLLNSKDVQSSATMDPCP